MPTLVATYEHSKPPEIASVKKALEAPIGAEAAIVKVGQLTDEARAEARAPVETEVLNVAQQSELDYIYAVWQEDLNKAGSDPGNKEAADKKHRKLVEVYESASAIKTLDKMNKLASDAGVEGISQTSSCELGSDMEGQRFGDNPEIAKRMLSQLEKEVKVLVRGKNKQKKLMTSLGRSAADIASALNSVPPLMTTGDVQDIYRYLKLDMMLSVVQERESAKVLIGDHGIMHVDDWDKRIALDIADDMGLSGVQKTRIGAAAKIHDIGYVNDIVAGETQQGGFGIDKNHAVVGAKIFRELSSLGFYKGLFNHDAQSVLNIHESVLFHDQVAKLDPNNKTDPNAQERSCLIAADVAAIFQEHKMPNAVVVAPEVFITAMYKIKLANENYTVKDPKTGERVPDKSRVDPELERIKAEATAQIDKMENLSEEERTELKGTVTQLNHNTHKILPGRLTTNVDVNKECGFNKDTGQIEFNFTPAVELSSIFGRNSNKQMGKMLEEFGSTPEEIKAFMTQNYADVAGGKVRITMNKETVPIESELQDKARRIVEKLRLENQAYLMANERLRATMVPSDHPDYILNIFLDPKAAVAYYAEMMMTGADFFKRYGAGTPDAIIPLLQQPTVMSAYQEHLFNQRLQVADSFLHPTN